MLKTHLSIFGMITIVFLQAQTLQSNMPAVTGQAYGIKAIGDTTYIYGNLNAAGGQTRNNIASFNTKTGALTSWNPVFNNAVNNIERVGNHLVAVGAFFGVNNLNRYNICMFDLNTGALENWSDGGTLVSTGKGGIGVDGHLFYFCKYLDGDYYVIAKADADAGVTTSWASDTLPNGDVNAIFVKDSFVYVGGQFHYSGADTVYDELCRFYKTTGKRDNSWHPHPLGGNYGVVKIESYHDHIFIGGDFGAVQGIPRLGIAEIDANGNVTNFSPNNSSGQIYDISVVGDYVWIAGNSHKLGNYDKWRIAEVNIASQLATCWDVSATSQSWSTAWSVSVVGDTVYSCSSDRPFIFVGTPRPALSTNAITGPTVVSSNQTAVYHLPFNVGNGYSWSVVGGTGSSQIDSISVTWGSGPTGLLKGVENNNSHINCSSDTVFLQVNIGGISDIKNIDNNSVSVFPNPTNGKVKVNATAATAYELSDVLGKILLREHETQSSFEVDLSPFASGLYFLNVYNGNYSNKVKLIRK